ncbi:MAG: S1 RNA-binding domain-containing protein [Ruminococcaceae bacterium]|nr:S1 RNA-binding domain-containing protein [Oscillospiraceae bacterium]
MPNVHAPEGMLFDTKENNEYVGSLQGLERAMMQGKILEGIALLCDAAMNLSFKFGSIYGRMDRSEVAFTPDGSPPKDIAVISRVGKAVCFKVIGFERGKNGDPIALLSRRAAQEEYIRSVFSTLVPGDILPSRVTHLEPFGAFVDIGCGVISLLSIDCISVSRISHPKDRFTAGQYIRTVVKSVDYDEQRIFVSHKELLGTWEENAARFTAGQTVTGIVRSIEDYGIFVELAPNLAGLAELREGVSVGQQVAVYIKSILPERMKIKLVLIDSFKAEHRATMPIEYYVPDSVSHMDLWQYSPDRCHKLVESVF